LADEVGAGCAADHPASVMSARSSRGETPRHRDGRLATGRERRTGSSSTNAKAGPIQAGRHRFATSAPAPFSLGGAPVSCKNTSSSVGRRSRDRSPRSSALRSAEAASLDHLESIPRAPEASAARAGPQAPAHRKPIPASAARALSRSAALTSSTSRICPPTRSLSSLPVPCAITRPWSITAICSAS